MTIKTRTGRAGLRRAVLIATVLSTALAALLLLPTGTVGAGAHDWVMSLPREAQAQLTTPGRLGALPVEYRKALFATLEGGEQKAAFWRSVFAHYRHQNRLSSTQESALRAAESHLTASFFAAGKRKPSPELLAAMNRVREALGVGAERELFRYAGPHSSTGKGLATGERLSYLWRSRLQPLLVAAGSPLIGTVNARFGVCQCSVGAYSGIDEDCWELYHNGWPKLYDCHFDLLNCPQGAWTEAGCGPWWMSPCDGVCYRGPNSPIYPD